MAGFIPRTRSVDVSYYGIFGLNDARTFNTTVIPTVVDTSSSDQKDTKVIQDVYNWTYGGNVGNSYAWFNTGRFFGSNDSYARYDFSNQTISDKGETVNFSNDTATGNFSGGWWSGSPGDIQIEKLDFSNDTAGGIARAQLSTSRSRLAATGNSNYGWFGGGYVNASVGSSTVDRLDYSNDSSSLVRGPLSLAREAALSFGNTNFGWFIGGIVPGVILPLPGPPTFHSRVDRIDFSNDSATASTRTALSTPRTSLAGTSNYDYGWYCLGNVSNSIPNTVISRIDFSNDTITTARAFLQQTVTTNRELAIGNFDYGLFFNVNQKLYETFNYSNDSLTVTSVTNNIGIDVGSTTGELPNRKLIDYPIKGGNFGWFGGSQAPAPVTSTVDRIDFSNDSSTASVRGPLSGSKGALAATANSNYGWFGGGRLLRSTVDRIDFSNDSSVVSVRGPLSLARGDFPATGNSNYGWFGGGGAPGSVSTVDRIDFSNDSSTASVRGPLSSERYRHSATGNYNYGWFGGGSSTSTVDRIDFSNDSAIASVRGTMTTNSLSGATANPNYGWFGGGGSVVSTVQRIDFSNDSGAASVRSPLSSVRQALAAAGNSNYGWFGGGSSTSTVDRIDFSNDSSTASVRGPLSVIRLFSSATSNTPIG